MNQLHLFSEPAEKGSREWKTFDPVAHASQTGMFRVLTPQPTNAPRYTNVVKIRRYHTPHQLFPKPAQ